MKVLLQRVSEAFVEVNNKEVGAIKHGYLLLVGFDKNEVENTLESMRDKIVGMKLFPDKEQRLSYSLKEVHGEVLIVSQFTLCAGLKKGRKPNFSDACEPKLAERLYNQWIELWKEQGITVQQGIFGADMQVRLNNDGPVTLFLDSKELFPSLYR